jgi:hypothetical protein
VRPEAEDDFARLLSGHWTMLHELGFVTGDRSLLLRSTAEPPTFVEIFTWVEGGFQMAHEHPDVLAIWERMDPLLEERNGLSKWEFPHYLPAALDG